MRKWFWIAPALLLAGCSKTNPTNSAAAVTPGASPAETAAAAPAPIVEVTIPEGSRLHVRIDEAVDTRTNHAGDHFNATLEEPVTVDGKTALPKGTRFTGHVTVSTPSGRLKGRAVLGLTLDSFERQGREYRIRTTPIDRVSASHKKRNVALIAGGTGLGAAIGALAGGGKGAAIGAAAGAGAGTAGAAATGKREVGVAAETAMVFTLKTAVKI
jgi:hypothetical protein